MSTFLDTTLKMEKGANQAEAPLFLTQPQRDNINRNRERAIELKRKRQQEEDDAKPKVACCEVCAGMDNLQASLFEFFEVNVCKACVGQTADYDLINKSTAVTDYLLPEDTLKFLPFKSVPNPHKKEWAAMKLFLRKIVRDKSYERWKDEDGLKTEKARRNVNKYRRELDSASSSSSSSSPSTSTDTPGAPPKAAAASHDTFSLSDASLIAASTSHIVAQMFGSVGDSALLDSVSAEAEEVAAASGPPNDKTKKAKNKRSSGANKKGLAMMIQAITGEKA